MAVSNVTPKVQYTGDNTATEFSFTFVVPASLTGGTITDSTGAIDTTVSTTTLTVGTADFFYTSDLVGKAITVTGAGSGSTTLSTTILSRTSGTVVELTDAASTSVTGQTVVVTTGTYATSMRNTSDLKVYLDSTLQTYTTDYTVLLNVGDDSNKQGKVIFNSAPATDKKITIIRDITLDRTTDFAAGGALTSKVLNSEFDSIVMAVQDSLAVDDFAVQFPPNEPSSTNTTLPSATTRANKLFQFDSSGNILISEDIDLGSTADLTLATLNATTGTITNFTGTTVDINGGAIDGTVIGANSSAAGVFTDLTASTLNVTDFGDTTHTGTTTMATVDINGGAIDGATVGATTPATGKFTTIESTSAAGTNTFASDISCYYLTATHTGTAINAPNGHVLTKKVTSPTGENLILTASSGQTTNITGSMMIDEALNFSTATSDNSGGGSRTYTASGHIKPNGNLMLDAYNNGTDAGNVFITTNGIITTDGVGFNPGTDDTVRIKDNAGGISLWAGTETGGSDATTPSVYDSGVVVKPGGSSASDFDTTAIELNNSQYSLIKVGDIFMPYKGTSSAGKFAKLKYLIQIDFNGTSPWTKAVQMGEVITQANTGYTGISVRAYSNADRLHLVTDTETWSTNGSDTLSGSIAGAYGRYVGTQSSKGKILDWHTPTSDDITEGSTNLYFTNARSDARFDTKLAAADTDDLAEGSTNKYMTNEAIDDRVNALVTDGEGITTTYDDTAGTLTFAAEDATDSNKGIASFSSDHFSVSSGAVSIGTDTIDNTLIDWGSTGNQVDTDDMPEGSTNLYFTDERVDDRVGSLLSAGTGISLDYNDASNVLTITNTNVGLANVVDDTSPQLGDGLDVNGHEIFSLSNADIKIQPHGTGAVLVGSDDSDAIISTNGTGDLTLTTNGQTIPTQTTKAFIKIEDGENGDIVIQPECDSNSSGEGEIVLAGMKWPKNGAESTSKYLATSTSDANQLRWVSTTAGDLVDESTPQLGGDLDVNGNDIVSTSNGSIDIKPDGDGAFTVDTEGSLEFKAGVSTGTYSSSNDSIKFLQHTTPPSSDYYIDSGNWGAAYAPVHIQGGLSIGGGTSPTVDLLYNTGLQIEAHTNGWPSIVLKSQADSDKFGNVWFVRSGDDASDGYCSADDRLGGFYASGYHEGDGNYNNTSAAVYFVADGNHTSSSMGGKIRFEAIRDGSEKKFTPLEIYGDHVDHNVPIKMGEVWRTFTLNASKSLTKGETLTQANSGATAKVVESTTNSTSVVVVDISGTWTTNSADTITGSDFGALSTYPTGLGSIKPSAVANHGFLYTRDVGGTGRVFALDADDTETQISPHNENGDWEHYSINHKTGQVTRINMINLIRDLEILTGRKYIENE